MPPSFFRPPLTTGFPFENVEAAGILTPKKYSGKGGGGGIFEEPPPAEQRRNKMKKL